MPASVRRPTVSLGWWHVALWRNRDTLREAAKLLELKTSTISGYIRSGRLAGRYDAELSGAGSVTTRAAVEAYHQRR